MTSKILQRKLSNLVGGQFKSQGIQSTVGKEWASIPHSDHVP
jgi:hypothetical protein